MLGQCESKKTAKSWGHTVRYHGSTTVTGCINLLVYIRCSLYFMFQLIAIEPHGLVDDFESKAASVLSTVKTSGPSIRLPGEFSATQKQANIAAGTLPLPKAIWGSICKTATEGLPPVR